MTACCTKLTCQAPTRMSDIGGEPDDICSRRAFRLMIQNGHWGVQAGGTPHVVVLKRLKAHFIFRYWSRAKAASGERHIWNPRAVQRLLSQLLVDVFT